MVHGPCRGVRRDVLDDLNRMYRDVRWEVLDDLDKMSIYLTPSLPSSVNGFPRTEH